MFSRPWECSWWGFWAAAEEGTRLRLTRVNVRTWTGSEPVPLFSPDKWTLSPSFNSSWMKSDDGPSENVMQKICWWTRRQSTRLQKQNQRDVKLLRQPPATWSCFYSSASNTWREEERAATEPEVLVREEEEGTNSDHVDVKRVKTERERSAVKMSQTFSCCSVNCAGFLQLCRLLKVQLTWGGRTKPDHRDPIQTFTSASTLMSEFSTNSHLTNV